MAETKKTTARSKTASVKKDSKPVEKASEVKAEEKAALAEAGVKEPAKRTRRSTAKTAEKAVEAKKAPAKRQPAKKAVKAEVKEAVHVEFGGKSYTSEDLLKSCRDVWKYDLNGKEEDIKSIELYVKPEESVTYYVINDEVRGSFHI